MQYELEYLTAKGKFTGRAETEDRLDREEEFIRRITAAASDPTLTETELGVYAYIYASGGPVSLDNLVIRFYTRPENVEITAEWQRQGVAGMRATLRKVLESACKVLEEKGYLCGGVEGWGCV